MLRGVVGIGVGLDEFVEFAIGRILEVFPIGLRFHLVGCIEDFYVRVLDLRFSFSKWN